MRGHGRRGRSDHAADVPSCGAGFAVAGRSRSIAASLAAVAGSSMRSGSPCSARERRGSCAPRGGSRRGPGGAAAGVGGFHWDWESVVWGKKVDLGGGRIIKKKKNRERV